MKTSLLTLAAVAALAAWPAAFAQNVSVEFAASSGRTQAVTVPANPERVAVGDYAVLDMLESWGLADRIAGSSPVDAVPYLKPVPGAAEIGGLKSVDPKAAKAAGAEILFVSGRLARRLDEFEKILPTVLVSPDFQGGALASFERNLRAVAQIFGKTKDAEAQIAGFRKRVEAVRAKADGETAAVIMVIGGRAGLLPPGGRGSMLTNEFGWKNVVEPRPADAPAPKKGGPAPTAEQIAKANAETFEKLEKLQPAQIFVLNKDLAVGAEKPTDFKALARAHAKNWNALDAVKAGRVTMIDPAAWYLGEGGPSAMDRMIRDAERAAGIVK